MPQIWLIAIYIIGWPLFFYVFARWCAKEGFNDQESFPVAMLSTFWPLAVTLIAFGFALHWAMKAIETAWKPFDKFYNWCVKSPPVKSPKSPLAKDGAES